MDSSQSSDSINPRQVFKKILLSGIGGAILIIACAAAGMNYVYRDYVERSAETNAIQLGQAFISIQMRDIFKNRPLSGLSQQEISLLDFKLEEYLYTFDIVKIKIFSPDHTIIYSSDKSIIGINDADNMDLMLALQGIPNSKLKNKGEIRDLHDEVRFDVDVVETYVPVFNANGKIIGAFETYKDSRLIYEDIQLGIHYTIAILVGILLIVFIFMYRVAWLSLLQVEHVQKNLHNMATHDGLTSLLNHREIMRFLKEEYLRFQRHDASSPDHQYSVIIADIDGFKQINDRFGHLAGDNVLQSIGKYLANRLRGYDGVSRYGGEEFLIILPSTDTDAAAAIAEELRSEIAKLNFDFEEKISMSFGISSITNDDENYQIVVQRADEALYKAKSNGKNRVEIN